MIFSGNLELTVPRFASNFTKFPKILKEKLELLIPNYTQSHVITYP